MQSPIKAGTNTHLHTHLHAHTHLQYTRERNITLEESIPSQTNNRIKSVDTPIDIVPSKH